MWGGELKPLKPDLWFAQIRNLAQDCMTLQMDGEAQAIRRAYHLVQIAPLAFRRAALGSCEIQETELESLLDQEKTVEAALATVSIDVTISDDQDGAHESKAIMVDEENRERRFLAASPALAIIGVWAEFIGSFAVQ